MSKKDLPFFSHVDQRGPAHLRTARFFIQSVLRRHDGKVFLDGEYTHLEAAHRADRPFSFFDTLLSYFRTSS